jgi:hypothetical protein
VFLMKKLVCMLGLAIALFAKPGLAQTAPIAHPDTADHLGHTFTIDVLANDIEPNGEALTVSIDGHTCPNPVTVVDGLVRVESTLGATAAGPSYDCAIAYRIEDETGRHGNGTVTLRALAPLYADGFESGTTGAWSSTVITAAAGP